MNEVNSMSALLDELSPELPASGATWDDVLARAQLLAGSTSTSGSAPRRSPRRVARKRLVLATALVTAIVIPLVAWAAVNDWWFFQFRDTPRPLSAPAVVASGSWSGHRWEMAAYNSGVGTCWSITFPDSNEIGGAWMYGVSGAGVTSNADNALGCGGIIGIRPPNPGALQLPTVMYMLGGSVDASYPSWIAGPVVASARTVVIRFPDGEVVSAPTTPPVKLGHVGWYGPVRFFAAQVPPNVKRFGRPQSVTGVDARGNVVACFVPALATSGFFTPLPECKG
jgi:hypothetical protein